MNISKALNLLYLGERPYNPDKRERMPPVLRRKDGEVQDTDLAGRAHWDRQVFLGAQLPAQSA